MYRGIVVEDNARVRANIQSLVDHESAPYILIDRDCSGRYHSALPSALPRSEIRLSQGEWVPQGHKQSPHRAEASRAIDIKVVGRLSVLNACR
jgi:hypothetical protein